MANSHLDENSRPTLTAVSNVDGTTIVNLYADPVTHRLLTDNTTGGDVVGPSSSTDKAVARFDGTTGKLIQNSAVTIADTTGIIAGTQGLTLSGSTSGTLALVATAISGTNTITFPAATGTVALTSGLAAYLPLAGGTMTGSILFTDNLYDIGATGATRPRSIYVGTLLTVPTNGLTINATNVTSTGTQLNYLSSATGTTGTTSTNLVFSASPTFTGTVTVPSPFTLGATSVTSTGTQLNYLSAATGTTGTTSTNIVFSTSPALTTPNIGVATATSVVAGNGTGPAPSFQVGSAANGFYLGAANTIYVTSNSNDRWQFNTDFLPISTNIGSIGATGTRIKKTWTIDLESTNMPTVNGTSLSSTFAPIASPTFTGVVTVPTPFTLGATSVTSTGTQLNYLNAATGTTGTASTNVVFSASPTFTGTVVLPTVTAGGIITLSENSALALDPAGSADGKYTGITVTGVAGYAQTYGDLVYLAVADSRWELADADASATAGPVMLAMVVVAGGSDGAACTLLLQGIIRADAKFPALTVGAPVYVGETAGSIQVAIPTGADNVIRVVGFALTADEIYFNPSQDHQITVA